MPRLVNRNCAIYRECVASIVDVEILPSLRKAGSRLALTS
jgi:hypothetical protein